MSRIAERLLEDPCLRKTSWADFETSKKSYDISFSGNNPAFISLEEQSSAEELVNGLELLFRVKQLEQEVEELKQAAFSQTFTIFINSLGIPNLEVKKPIPVTIEKEGEEDYIASFMDANISTGGKSEQEAVYNLQSLIADLFEMHEEETSELGPAMKIQNQVLHDVLCRR
jgi:predicted RNase H-like HicB family nuclease